MEIPRDRLEVLDTFSFTPDTFPRLQGTEVTMNWLRSSETPLNTPIIISSPEGLGMDMPPASLTARDVASMMGPQSSVEVMRVGTQARLPGWTLEEWANYVETPPEDRQEILNVISLEVTGTKLGEMVRRPEIVRALDWVDLLWKESGRQKPRKRPKKGESGWPKVQTYCLMGVKDAYTDFHVDFGGTSVYYHILSGAKTFYFIAPTPRNLTIYEKWCTSTDQSFTFLGELVDQCVKVELQAGNTMIIPTGWIHAVRTPEDAMVIGGNFLHGLNIPGQLAIAKIEERTHVPQTYRFPYWYETCWRAAVH
ncbi:hypothetical protein BJ684DRAFT_7523, partial [Piptocephalis cylindrospora]